MYSNLIFIIQQIMAGCYTSTKNHIRKVFDYLKNEYSECDLEHILYPDRIIKVNIPIKMDNWKTETFVGYRAQHNNSRWPYKWGIRFFHSVTEEEIITLSIWMSIKTALVWLPLWWGKWWVLVDVNSLSKMELEKLSRWYVRKIFRYLWPNYDVPAPDVGTNPQIMAWMTDEYNRITSTYSPGVFTGKPLNYGGSKGRFTATSDGWFFVLNEYLKNSWQDLNWKKIAIQWAGNAALWILQNLISYWASIVAISDSKWGIYDKNWLNPQQITEIKNNKKSVIDYDWWQVISNQELIELDVDVLILAALENQINSFNAEKINANYILELANWPIDLDIENILLQNKIKIIPDILASAWGVIVSYFEQVQNNMNYYRKANEVAKKLKKTMETTVQDVDFISKEYQIDFRSACYIIAIKRILETMKIRGDI